MDNVTPKEKKHSIANSITVRSKLLQKGLNRDKSALTTRHSNYQKDAFSRPLSLERLNPLKAFITIPSPLNLKSISNGHLNVESTQNTPQNSKLSSNRLLKTSTFINKLWKLSMYKKAFTPEVLTLLNEFSDVISGKHKEAVENLINDLKTLKIGSFYSSSLCEKIEDVAGVFGLIKFDERRRRNPSKTKEVGLGAVIRKFKIRTIGNLKVQPIDVNLYASLLILLGIIDKKLAEKSNMVLDVMQKFISTPGVALKSIQSLPKMIKDTVIDKGKTYTEKAIISYHYYSSTLEYTQTSSNLLIIKMLNEVYDSFNINRKELKAKFEENPNRTSSRQKINTDLFKPLKLSIGKKETTPKSERISRHTEKIEKSICEFETKSDAKSDFSALNDAKIYETLATEKSVEILENNLQLEVKKHNGSIQECLEDIEKAAISKDVDFQYQFQKNCKSLLLQKFFSKNGQSLWHGTVESMDIIYSLEDILY